MRTRFFTIIIALISFCVSAEAKVTIQQWKTQNGVPVYFVAKHEIPIADVAVAFSAGSARDGKQWGLASLTASLLNQGTQTKNADQIAEAFDSVGVVFSASASRDSAIVSLRTMLDKKYFDTAIDLYLEVLSQPRFDQSELVRLKHQMINSIKLDSENPSRVASKAFYHMIYGDQPYGHPISGTEQSLSALTQADVNRFYHQFYVNQNAKILMVGDLTDAAAKSLANKIAAALPNGTAPLPIAKMKQVTQGKSQQVKMSVSQDAILIGQLGIDYNNPHYFDLLVANHVLGGSFMMRSLLMQQLREKNGYTYGVYSGFYPLQAGGLFAIDLRTRNEKTKAAKDMALKILKQYWQQGPTQAQLDEAKAYLQGSFPIEIASNSAILSQLVRIAVAGLPLDYIDQYVKNISAVTVASAKEAFSQAVDINALDTVIAGKQ